MSPGKRPRVRKWGSSRVVADSFPALSLPAGGSVNVQRWVEDELGVNLPFCLS